MDLLSLENPVFVTFALTASLAILKIMGQGWMTVVRMMKAKGGYASPEDIRQTRLNPDPNLAQLEIDDYVDRSRRMHRNDLENIPAFLTAGLLYVLIAPPLWAANVLMWGFIAARAAHAWAYGTAKTHDTRAAFYTVGSICVIVMAVWVFCTVLLSAL